jgi:large conductance mechanosensitive channel
VSLLGDFEKLLLRGNVVDLAVAVVIGTAFGLVVKALVADLLTPIIALIFGQPDFGTLSFTVATQSWSATGGQTALTGATLLFVKGVDLLAVRQAGAVVERNSPTRQALA